MLIVVGILIGTRLLLELLSIVYLLVMVLIRLIIVVYMDIFDGLVGILMFSHFILVFFSVVFGVCGRFF